MDKDEVFFYIKHDGFCELPYRIGIGRTFEDAKQNAWAGQLFITTNYSETLWGAKFKARSMARKYQKRLGKRKSMGSEWFGTV